MSILHIFYVHRFHKKSICISILQRKILATISEDVSNIPEKVLASK